MSDNENERWQSELDKEIEAFVLSESEEIRRTMVDVIDCLCQSPIERLLASRLFLRRFLWLGIPEIVLKANAELKWAIESAADDRVTIFPQVTIGAYRADFLLILKAEEVTAAPRTKFMVALAIECDGHDFHEKTKEQAARDRKRDRSFQRAGLRIFRFTGSEIFRDPGKCADEIVDFVADRLEASIKIGEE